MKMTQKELDAVLAAHYLWLRNEGGAYANLENVDLTNARLINANLRGVPLSYADLSGANLECADLQYAKLRNTKLTGANLIGANLSCAILVDTDLRHANLIGADLTGTNLLRAKLSDGILRNADLKIIRADMVAEILRLPNELEVLRLALIQGNVNGSTYSGDCSCLAGTLARAHGEKNYNGHNIENAGLVFPTDTRSPRECFFFAIQKGDTPETNQVSSIALEWVNEAIAIRDMIRATAPQAV